jgi:hypothetical protein
VRRAEEKTVSIGGLPIKSWVISCKLRVATGDMRVFRE